MSKTTVSKPRIRMGELDFARALPLLGLPFVHWYESCANVFMFGGPVDRGVVFLYLCMLGPSVFMICLGMNIVFSTRNSPEALARRGGRTLLLFMALNLMRYVIPAILPTLCGCPEEMHEALYYSLASDILAFAGLAFLFFSLMRRRSIEPFFILLIALGLLTADMLIPEPSIENKYLSMFLGNFFYVDHESCFPFLSWLIFPATGYCLGAHLRRIDDPRRFWARTALGCATGLCALCVGMRLYGLNPLLIAASPVNDSITDLANVALDILIAGVWFGCACLIYHRVHYKKFRSAVDFLSRGILVFYCVQWVVVGWLEETLRAFGLLGQNIFNDVTFLLTASAVFLVSLGITVWIQKKRAKPRFRPPPPRVRN